MDEELNEVRRSADGDSGGANQDLKKEGHGARESSSCTDVKSLEGQNALGCQHRQDVNARSVVGSCATLIADRPACVDAEAALSTSLRNSGCGYDDGPGELRARIGQPEAELASAAYLAHSATWARADGMPTAHHEAHDTASTAEAFLARQSAYATELAQLERSYREVTDKAAAEERPAMSRMAQLQATIEALRGDATTAQRRLAETLAASEDVHARLVTDLKRVQCEAVAAIEARHIQEEKALHGAHATALSEAADMRATLEGQLVEAANWLREAQQHARDARAALEELHRHDEARIINVRSEAAQVRDHVHVQMQTAFKEGDAAFEHSWSVKQMHTAHAAMDRSHVDASSEPSDAYTQSRVEERRQHALDAACERIAALTVELADRQRTYENALRAGTEAHARAVAELQQVFECAAAGHRDVIATLEAKHAEARALLRGAHDASLREDALRLVEECAEGARRSSVSRDALEQQAEEWLREALLHKQEETDVRIERANAAATEARFAIESELRSVKKRHHESVATARAEIDVLRGKLEQQQRTHDSTLAALEQAHAVTVTALTTVHERALANYQHALADMEKRRALEMDASHRRAVSATEAGLRRAASDASMMRALNERMRNDDVQHRAAVAALEAEIVALRSKLSVQRCAYDESLRASVAGHDHVVSELKQSHEAAMASYLEAVATLEQRHARVPAVMRETHSSADIARPDSADLNTAVQESVSNQPEFESRLRAVLTSIAAQQVTLQEQLQATRDRLLLAHSDAATVRQELRERADVERAALEEQLRVAVRGALDGAAVERNALESRVRAVEAERDLARADARVEVEQIGHKLASLLSNYTSISDSALAARAENEAMKRACRVMEEKTALAVEEMARHRHALDGVPAPIGDDVTMCFTDVEASTAQWEWDGAAMGTAIRLHNNVMRAALSTYGGYEVKTEGDAFMVAFADPVAAVRWCVDVQTALLHVPWPARLLEHAKARRVVDEAGALLYCGLRVRMGLHCGAPACEPDPVTGRMDYFGPIVNRSARMASIAKGGQIIVSRAVYDRVAGALAETSSSGIAVEAIDLGFVELRGIADATHIMQLLPLSLRERSSTFVSSVASPHYDRHGSNDYTADDEHRTLEHEMRELRAANDKLQRKLDTLKSRVLQSLNASKQLLRQVQQAGYQAASTPQQLLAALHARLGTLMAEQEATVTKIEKTKTKELVLRRRASELSAEEATVRMQERAALSVELALLRRQVTQQQLRNSINSTGGGHSYGRLQRASMWLLVVLWWLRSFLFPLLCFGQSEMYS